MEVKKTIEMRKALRNLGELDVTDELIFDIAYSLSLAPSCYNKQPWRFVFVRDKEKLAEIFSALPEGNSWMKNSSLIVAVFTKKEFDCVVKNREYFLFDTGIATGFLILRATELGLIAHPTAGYDELKVKNFLKIPDDFLLITLIAVGKIPDASDVEFAESVNEIQSYKRNRLSFSQFGYIDEVNTSSLIL